MLRESLGIFSVIGFIVTAVRVYWTPVVKNVAPLAQRQRFEWSGVVEPLWNAGADMLADVLALFTFFGLGWSVLRLFRRRILPAAVDRTDTTKRIFISPEPVVIDVFRGKVREKAKSTKTSTKNVTESLIFDPPQTSDETTESLFPVDTNYETQLTASETVEEEEVDEVAFLDAAALDAADLEDAALDAVVNLNAAAALDNAALDVAALDAAALYAAASDATALDPSTAETSPESSVRETLTSLAQPVLCSRQLFVPELIGGRGSDSPLTVEDIYIEAMTLDAEIRVFRRQLDASGRRELARIIAFCRDALHRKLLLRSVEQTQAVSAAGPAGRRSVSSENLSTPPDDDSDVPDVDSDVPDVNTDVDVPDDVEIADTDTRQIADTDCSPQLELIAETAL